MRFFTLALIAIALPSLFGCANRDSSGTTTAPTSATLTPMQEETNPAPEETQQEEEPQAEESQLVVDLDFVPPEETEGWTEFVRANDTEIVFVSSSEGNDNNDGALPETAVRTLARGKAIMESLDPNNEGSENWMVLKRGDTWNESFRTWNRSGISSSQRLLIGTYGPGSDPRPRVLGGSRDGFHVGHNVRHVAIVGIHLESSGNSAFAATSNNMVDILVEDCVMTRSQIGFQAQGTSDGLKVRRSQITNNPTLGMFTQRTNNMLIEENIIDSNGTSITHNHNMYISHPGTNTTIRNNLITRGANHGLKFRGPHVNGVIEGNVFAGNRNSVTIQCKDQGERNVNVSFRNNVVVEIGHDGQHNPLRVTTVRDLVIENNLFAHAADYRAQAGIQFALPRHVDSAPNGNWPAIENVTVRGNVLYNINGLGIHFQDSMQGKAVEIVNMNFTNNVISVPDSDSPRAIIRCDSATSGLTLSNNSYDCPNSNSQWFEINDSWHSFDAWVSATGDSTSAVGIPSFTDPTRTLSEYHGTLGGGTNLEAFLTEAKRQSKYTWRLEYTPKVIAAYIRAGYDLDQP